MLTEPRNPPEFLLIRLPARPGKVRAQGHTHVTTSNLRLTNFILQRGECVMLLNHLRQRIRRNTHLRLPRRRMLVEVLLHQGFATREGLTLRYRLLYIRDRICVSIGQGFELFRVLRGSAGNRVELRVDDGLARARQTRDLWSDITLIDNRPEATASGRAQRE